MFILRKKKIVGSKAYRTVLLVESVWNEEKKSPRHKTILNLSKWDESYINALDMALKGKQGFSIQDLETASGKSVGGLIVIKKIADRIGITGALGKTKYAGLTLLLIMGRILSKGSRLKLCEWGETQEIETITGVRSYNEDRLYETLDWLSANQEKIEQRLFKHRYKKDGKKPALYLYDITSSYLEGDCNDLGEYGYNRDGKRGKKQIVVGLMTDKKGIPVSIEVFKGNTSDSTTVIGQIEKMATLFGVEKLVFVGDRGMLKSTQINTFSKHINYITAITKEHIKTLVKTGVIQLELFEEDLTEIEDNGIRYFARRNPIRAKEIQKTRADKIANLSQKIDVSNRYLKAHPKAKASTQLAYLNQQIKKVCLAAICSLSQHDNGKIQLVINQKKEDELRLLDGCYVIKTDLRKDEVSAQQAHQRYKDLAFVEKAFRTMKTGCLEIRPIFVRKESRTRGHVFVTMLAYMIVQHFWEHVRKLNITLDHAWNTLDHLHTTIVKLNDKSVNRIPTPSKTCQNILTALDIKLPDNLPLVVN